MAQDTTLENMRDFVKRSIKSDANYSADEIDRAALVVLEDFIQEVKPTIASHVGTVGGTSAEVDIPATATRFRPERAIRFELYRFDQGTSSVGNIELEHSNYDHVRRYITAGTSPSTTADPSYIAFRDHSGKAFMDAAPGTTYSYLRVTYYDALARWAPGASGTSVINIDSSYLGPAMWDGIAAYTVHRDPAERWGSDAWMRYTEHKTRIKGRVTLDGNVHYKQEDRYI